MLRLRVTACHPWGSPTIVTFGGPQELARQLAKGTMVGYPMIGCGRCFLAFRARQAKPGNDPAAGDHQR